jgi:membrane-bound metal-dependent hydrolase YbcI (DUF457 family)
MMGSNHAATGAAGWLIVTTQFTVPLELLNKPTGLHLANFNLGFGLGGFDALAIVLFAFVVAGAALAPDADHHNATIAHSLPPLSNLICGGIGAISGGHRHGTHSIVGIAAFTGIAYAAGLWRMDIGPFANVGIGAGIISLLLVAFAAKALRVIPDTMRKLPWFVGIIGGTLVAFLGPGEAWVLPFAVALGCAIHIAGDMLTTEGVNLFWPFAIKAPKFIQVLPVINRMWKSNGYMAAPILGSAGSMREFAILIPVSLYVIVAVMVTLVGAGQVWVKTTLAALGWA